MPYPNDNKLNIIISQTSGSVDGSGKFPFVEKLISGSNLFLVTDADGVLTGSTSIPNANFTSLTASNLLVTDNTTLGDSTTDLIKITGSLSLSGSFSTVSASFSDLTANRVVYTDGNKILSTDANLTFDGTTLTATNISNTNFTSSNISASNNISGSKLWIKTNITDAGTLTVVGASTLAGLTGTTATFSGLVSASAGLTASTIYDAGTLTVVGNSILSNVFATNITASNISASGNISASTLRVETSIIDGGTLTVLGNTTLGDTVSDTTRITGSVSISGSLSVVGNIAGTIETASRVVISNVETSTNRHFLTFVPATNGTQPIYTDSSSLSYFPTANKLQLGASGEIVLGDGNAIINIVTDPGNASVSIGTTNSGSLIVGGNTVFKVNSLANLTEIGTLVTMSNEVSITDTTQATNWDNGALVVAGGVGIGKNLYVSGSTFLYGDLTIFGSSSIVNISSSTVIIGDNRILLNAGSPILRYAGLDVYDSGSGGIQSNVTSSMLWDSLNDNWLIFSANSASGAPLTASSAIIIGGPTGAFGSETTLTNNFIPKAQSSGKNITNSLLSDNGTTLAYTGTGISASQITSSNALYTNIFATNISSSFITASRSQLTNVYSTYISSSQITSSNLRVQLTGSITYATGVLVTYVTGSFNTLTLTTGSFPGNAPGLVPNTPTSSGMPGQINVDNNFIYVYTNNVWKRVPLAQWFN